MSTPPRYTIFYDANCRLCVRSRRMLERLRPRAEMAFVDVNDGSAMERFPMVDRRASLGQMFVLDPSGQLSGGYDAFLALVPSVPSLRSLRHLLRRQPIRSIGWTIYRWVARNRYRLGGSVSCDAGVCARPAMPPVPAAPPAAR